MRYETQIDLVIDNESKRIRDVYEDIICSYLVGSLPEHEYWHVLDCQYFDFSIIDRDLAEKLDIWTDQYLVYGIHRGIYYHKFIPRDEFEAKLKENGVPYQ